MPDDNITVWDWLSAQWKTPLWRKTVRLAAAGGLAAAGVYSLAVSPNTANWIPLFAAAVVLLILGLRISIPERPLPVVPGLPEAVEDSLVQAEPASAGPEGAPVTDAQTPSASETGAGLLAFLRLPLAAVAALSAQWVMDFRPLDIDGSRNLGWALYAVSFLLLGWALLAGDASFGLGSPGGVGRKIRLDWPRAGFLAGAVFFGLLAYAGSAGGMFRALALVALAIAAVYWWLALADYSGSFGEAVVRLAGDIAGRIRSGFSSLAGGIRLSPWSLLVAACFGALAVFRTVDLANTPPEMTSDHIEKLANVVEILGGKTYIFFANNGGREPLEFYLVALVSQAFGTGISFLSLKIVSVAVGILTLPFLYLLGRELADRRVGLLAMILCGIGYWPDMISRLGLRLPLAMLFSAATLYFFFKALRRRTWNDFLWAGMALGIGMYGYTPMRLVPVGLVIITALFLLHPSSKGYRLWAVTGFLVTTVTTLLLFAPFLRYAHDYPNDFWLRTFTRILPETGEGLADPLGTLAGNVGNALQMFSWNNGVGWFNCVPLRPALDVVTGAFFHLGWIGMLVHGFQKRSWEALSLFFLVPALLLPSILALALPGENPSLARAVAAVPVSFLLPALAMTMSADFLRSLIPSAAGRRVGAACLAVGIAVSAAQNYDLTHRQYPETYRLNSENASEIGIFMREFSETIGRLEDAYFIPFPYWIDHRIANVYAGIPLNSEDHFVYPDAIPAFSFSGRPTLFLLLAEDSAGLEALRQKFPNGYYGKIVSAYPTRDFIYFLVPGTPE